MKVIAVVVLVFTLTGCAWMRGDADGDPATPGTRGQTIGRTISESSSLFGPFAGIAVLVGVTIAALSKKEEDE